MSLHNVLFSTCPSPLERGLLLSISLSSSSALTNTSRIGSTNFVESPTATLIHCVMILSISYKMAELSNSPNSNILI